LSFHSSIHSSFLMNEQNVNESLDKSVLCIF